MKIGDINIHLRNMSKNQREYWRQMKRIYDEAIKDGLIIDAAAFILSQATHRVTKQILETLKDTDAPTHVGYDNDFNAIRERVENLIDYFSIPVYHKRRRSYDANKSTIAKSGIANKLKELVNTYDYAIAWDAWLSIPLDVRNAAWSKLPEERYKAIIEIYELLNVYAVGENDNDTEEYEYDVDVFE